jgi:hypothetical protein
MKTTSSGRMETLFNAVFNVYKSATYSTREKINAQVSRALPTAVDPMYGYLRLINSILVISSRLKG